MVCFVNQKLEDFSGCSSVGGMFEELGPFYVDADGKTLYENIFAWNKVIDEFFNKNKNPIIVR